MSAFPSILPHQRAAIIVAGGTGTRMGGGMPKQFLPLSGKPVMVHTLERFLHWDEALLVVVVMYPEAIAQWEEILQEWFAPALRARIHTCEGGAERTDSVHNGLRTLAAAGVAPSALVAVHDAVRPFLLPPLLETAYATAAEYGSSVCAVSVKASLRMRTDTGSVSVDRSRYMEVQTPQVFRFDLIANSYDQRPHNRFTDDASLIEHLGHPVMLCEGSYDNIKLTTPEDLFVGERILARQQPFS